MSDKIGKYNVSETDEGTLLVQHESINDKEVQLPQGEPMVINGAWYINQLPNHIVLERQDGTLAKFFLSPFRAIKESDLTQYKSYHPRKCKGQPLPDYLYRFYGLVKNDETLSEVIRVRVSPSEKEKLDAAALAGDKNTSEFLRDWIRTL